MTALLPLLLAASVGAAEPPAGSLYHLPIELTGHRGESFQLSERRGKAQLVSMFYSTCRFACPLIVSHIKTLDRMLSEEEREKVEILVVSFDPERDTVEQLAKVAQERDVTSPRWVFARAEDRDVRQLAALLDVRYRKLEDGEFNHTNVLALLDQEGRVAARTDILGPRPDDEFMAKVREVLGTPAPAEKKPEAPKKKQQKKKN